MKTCFGVLVGMVAASALAGGDATVASRPDCPTTRLERPATPEGRTKAVIHASRSKPLPVRWTSQVGRTTFRTTMAIDEGTLVIGTHGATLDGKDELNDGVYVLEAKTGKKVWFIQTPGEGDRDVGGVAVANGRVFFGSDNGQLVASPIEGVPAWKVPLHGKVRPAPALGDLDGDGKLEVVVGDEAGVLTAVTAEEGTVRWAVQTGDNEYGAHGFIGAAAIADADGDGKDDVIAGARDGVLRAYRGRDGVCLWALQGDSGIHASPSVVDFDGDGRLEVLAAWSYGDVVIADLRTGLPRAHLVMQQDDGAIEGLFATPAPVPSKAGGLLVAPTAWWDEDDGVLASGQRARAWRSKEGRVSSSPVVADLDGDGVAEAIFGTEKGLLLSVSAEGRRTVLAELKGGVEAPPMLADVDGDGRLELFVASNDGVLTCFSTRASSAVLARFRGAEAANRGHLGAISLGWKLAPVEERPLDEAPPALAEWNARFDNVQLSATPSELTATEEGAPLFSLCALQRFDPACTADARHRLVSLVGQYLGVESSTSKTCGGKTAEPARELRTIDVRTGHPVRLTTLFAPRDVQTALGSRGATPPGELDRFVIRDLVNDKAVVDLRLGNEEFRLTLSVPKTLLFGVRAAKSGRSGFVEANAPGVRVRCRYPADSLAPRRRD